MPALFIRFLLALGMLSSAATTWAVVTITGRTDSVNARLGNIQGPTPSDESTSEQLLGLVDQTASAELGDADRSTISLASRVTRNTDGFVAAIERLDVGYSTERIGGSASSSAEFSLEFEVDGTADYDLAFDDQRALLPLSLSSLVLTRINPDSTRTTLFGSDGFFGSELLGFFGERTGRLSAGTYELNAGASVFVIDDGFATLPIVGDGEAFEAFSLTVMSVPEPRAILLMSLLGLARVVMPRSQPHG